MLSLRRQSKGFTRGTSRCGAALAGALQGCVALASMQLSMPACAVALLTLLLPASVASHAIRRGAGRHASAS